MTLREDATELAPELVALRRALHQVPEIGLDLPKTQRLVLDALDGLPLDVSTGRGLSSVTAVLRGGTPGPAVLLRGDMDALPVQEPDRYDFASRHPGVMHACGHDLHTAGLVGGIAAAHGLTVEAHYQPECPPTINDPAEYEFTARTLRELFRRRPRSSPSGDVSIEVTTGPTHARRA